MKYPGGFVAPMLMRLLFLLLSSWITVLAGPLKFTSGENRTHLIELYSSEGCSSCPPAEAWLGGLRVARGLWRDFVPVAFHVSYWDRLGWRDRLAQPEFTTRQHDYAGFWRSDTVYTPEFVLDGQEWPSAYNRTPPSLSAEKTGILKIEYEKGGVCRVAFAGPMGDEIHVALLGGGIVSDVRAGENEGRRLHHEFVVLALQSALLSDGTAELNLPQLAGEKGERHAVAAWITRHGEVTPLQATGGWLD